MTERNVSAFKRSSIEVLNGIFNFLWRVELDETGSLRVTLLVVKESRLHWIEVVLLEKCEQLLLIDLSL